MPLDDRDYMKRSAQPSRRGSRGNSFNDWLMQNPVLAIIGVNIVFFIATSLQPSVKDSLGMTPLLVAHRPWTILTAMFVHNNWEHIFFNMLALYFFGRMLTAIIGSGRFILIYFVGGIVGNLLFLAINFGSPSLLIGASGAVYAVSGALAVLVPKAQIRFWGVIPMPLWVYVLIFLVILSLPPFVPLGIAWQAHMGGLVAGLVGGYLWRRTGKYYYFR
jgi:membrane associated rhomboid family serine protease